MYQIGIDIGSTTAKVVLLRERKLIFSAYVRHNTKIHETLVEILEKILRENGEISAEICITGSVGMGVSEKFGIPFVQEVVASAELIKKKYPNVRTLIDVGGEDTKLVLLNKGINPDIRMNGNCAGGTGAFIDQMAGLMNIELEELNDLALKSTTIYPIASRCGVFAKTDVQNLLSRNTAKEDIAASIFHAVAVQCVNALSRGADIKPKIAFCGGPLTFIPALKKSFMKILKLKDGDITDLQHSELVPAIGAAISTTKLDERKLKNIVESIKNYSNGVIHAKSLPRLFRDEKEYSDWSKKRMESTIKRAELKKNEKYFMGIDSGSTTTKIVLIDSKGCVSFEYYVNNNGNPIGAVKGGLEKIKENAEKKGITLNIAKTAVTGYGEDLIKAAFGIDKGVVETLAHYNAAKKFSKNVSFILDIGGQDMKAMFITDGIITDIEINEACSSGCGSFIENFANSLGISVKEFAERACRGENPCDLGTRCTVFMNSKVKQYLREGTSVEDLSAGLAYSVIKNCFNKVLKMNNFSVLGKEIVVQGGAFRNPAVHRAMELIVGKKVHCSDMPELMGAVGSAIIAKEDYKENKNTTFDIYKGIENCESFTTKQLACRGCENNCGITQLVFSNNNTFYTGNKCEKIFTNKGTKVERGISLPEIKYINLFERNTNPEGKPKGTIGIPRVLNMFENYPFWCTLLVHSGFKVKLSSRSTNQVVDKGLGTVMSENICFPAKIVHGHIMDLVHSRVDRIFYPIVVYEKKESAFSRKSYNCPIVSGYPEVIRSSVNPEKYKVAFDRPVVSFDNVKLLKKACYKYLKKLRVDNITFNKAFDAALNAQKEYHESIIREGTDIIENSKKKRMPLMVLTGRPYHIDPLIDHKIHEIITGFGVNLITEDSLPSLYDKNIRVMDQWSYPGRVYNAAHWCGKNKSVMVQLNSFGCGPDAIVCDEAKRIMHGYGAPYTLVRIDEISSPGGMKLRIRSLVDSMKAKEPIAKIKITSKTTPVFERDDRKKTILAPFFSPIYSPFLVEPFRRQGFNVEILPPPDIESVNLGLKYANNEICYPATIVIGDIIRALQSGKYDLSNVAVGITQTGGQCRATNYLALIKKALVGAGFENVPVVSVSTVHLDFNPQPGFKYNKLKMFRDGLRLGVYADALANLYYSTAVREINKGDALKARDKYIELGIKHLKNDRSMLKLLSNAVTEFNKIKTHKKEVPKIGIVGEIYVKYNPFSHANIVDWLIDQGIEVVVPPITNFFIQVFVNNDTDIENNLKKRQLLDMMMPVAERYVNYYLSRVDNEMKRFKHYHKKASIRKISLKASEVLNLAIQFGEGWLLPGEIMIFAEEGVNDVLCLQPFGCIANHVVAKGVEKRMKEINPKLNILYLDMDHGSSEANLYNRLHFLIKNTKKAEA